MTMFSKSRDFMNNTTMGLNIGMAGVPMAGLAAGAMYGSTQSGEGSVSKYGDIGFQVGGLGSAAYALQNTSLKRATGSKAMGALVGVSGATALGAMMQSDDAGTIQRAGVMVGMSAVGAAAGVGVSMFSKPIGRFLGGY